jgi:hypothetical protein
VIGLDCYSKSSWRVINKDSSRLSQVWQFKKVSDVCYDILRSVEDEKQVGAVSSDETWRTALDDRLAHEVVCHFQNTREMTDATLPIVNAVLGWQRSLSWKCGAQMTLGCLLRHQGACFADREESTSTFYRSGWSIVG